MVAKKDFFAPKHPDVDVPNLHVIKACTVSLVTSSVFVMFVCHCAPHDYVAGVKSSTGVDMF